jgi:[ribosomal protein S5]-alanine N-acetyltransferase
VPIYMNEPGADVQGGKRSSQGADAFGRFSPVLSAHPDLLGSLQGAAGPEVAGFAMADVLEGEAVEGLRIALRPLQPDDFDAWQSARRSMGDEYLAAGGAGDADAFELRCRSLAFASLLGTSATFGLFTTDAAGGDLVGGLVGELELAFVTAAGMSSAILSIWLVEAAQGQGLAIDACILAMEHVFEQRGMHRLELPVPPGSPTRRSLEAVGCRDEGVAVAYARTGDGWADHVRYALTAEDWADRGDRLKAVAHDGRRLVG